MIGHAPWSAVKLIVSSIALAFGMFILWGMSVTSFNAGMLALASVFLVLAAFPWVDLGKPTRAIGLVAICMSIGGFVLGFVALAAELAYPRDCKGRFPTCELMNQLYAIGGNRLIAAVFFIIAVFFLVCGALLALYFVREKLSRPADPLAASRSEAQ